MNKGKTYQYIYLHNILQRNATTIVYVAESHF